MKQSIIGDDLLMCENGRNEKRNSPNKNRQSTIYFANENSSYVDGNRFFISHEQIYHTRNHCNELANAKYPE